MQMTWPGAILIKTHSEGRRANKQEKRAMWGCMSRRIWQCMCEHLCGRAICCKMAAQRGWETNEDRVSSGKRGKEDAWKKERKMCVCEHQRETVLRLVLCVTQGRWNPTYSCYRPLLPPSLSLSALFYRVVLTASVRCWLFPFSPAGKEETKQ